MSALGNIKNKRTRSGGPNRTQKRHRQKEDATAFIASSLADVPFRRLYHYPSQEPFPVIMGDDFPAEPYRSRHDDIKSSIHWGQRKLMLSEIQMLTMYCEPEVSYHIVYAGAAPGTHLSLLDDLFAKRHTWELVDPGEFDHAALDGRPNMVLRNEFFTNDTAYGINARRLTEVLPGLATVYAALTRDALSQVEGPAKLSQVEGPAKLSQVEGPAKLSQSVLLAQLQDAVGQRDVARGTAAIPSAYEPPLRLPRGLELLCQVGLERRGPLLFISDIRSGALEVENFEDHVAENMRAQEVWTEILHGAYSMLKFRLPYTRKAKSFGGRDEEVQTRLIRPDGCVSYLRGDILLPIWTRPTSTEGRLVVPQGAFPKDYNVAHVEDQFFFFNTRVREQIHFNHFLDSTSVLDHHFDGAAEVMCLKMYLEFMFPRLKDAPVEELRDEVERVSRSITNHLGTTFRNTIYRRNALLIKQAQSNSACRSSLFNIIGDKAKVPSRSDDDESCSSSGDQKTCKGDTKILSSTDQCNTTHSSLECEPSQPMNDWEASTWRSIYLAERERKLLIWKINLDESKYNEPSGLWVTTSIEM
ncbi:unnamed protein product [Phytomonas sp. EM1]|nr:unnamed protein product [Phytomonas sp. EM1]|eukprot:CCW62173.1 unnamed protein product [Phytomonas sp. isolate EM1]